MQAFSARHPQVRLGLSVGNRGQVLDWLVTHDADVAFGGRPPNDERIDARPFRPNELVLVGAARDPLAGATPSPLTSSAGARGCCASPTPERDRPTRSSSPPMHCTARRLTVGSNGAIRQAARIGLGISFLSADAVASDVDSGLLGVIAIDPAPPPRAWHVMRVAVGPARPLVDEFVAFVTASAGLALRRGHRGLAEADGAVVGRQALGHEHAQARVLEQRRRELEQQPVLPHAAGEHDGVQAARAGGLGARLRGGARDRAMEARADQRRGSTPAAT